MKRIISFISLLFLSFNLVFAQTLPKLPSQCKVYLPKVLFKGVLSESETAKLASSSNYGQDKSEEPAVKKYWEVYSDRNNNKLYTSPDAAIECGELEFNEKIRIADIKGKYALVYSDPIGTYPEITQHAKPKGWINMDNLLLWSSCPADEKGIYYKALICYNISTIDKTDLAGYENPFREGASFELNTDLKFYFIMKKVNGMVLLSSEYTLEGESSKVLYAWVPEGAYVPWNQRSCLEPTWEKEDVAYFSAKKIVADVCIDRDLKEALTSFDFIERAGGESDRYFYRMRPDDLRYPILDGSTDVLYEVSSFGSLGGKTTVTTGGARREDDSELVRKQKALDKLSKLNLVIVIDGTKSMDKYFPAVKDAISKGSEFFSSQHYDMKVGVVIYRDYADGEAGLSEVYPMSKPDDSGLANFIYNGGKYGITSSSADRTHTEAVYYGIQEGLKLFSDPNEFNIMLVVGDCGNDPLDKRIEQSSLVNSLSDMNVNFMGFQVRNNNIPDWTLFNNQMVQIMRQTTQRRYDALVPGALKVRPKLLADGYEMQNDLDIAIFVGAHKYALNGTELSAERLTDLMIESISYCAKSVQDQKDAIVSYDPRRSMGGTNDVVDATAKFNKALVQKLMGDDFDLISTNTLISFRGWVKKTDETGRKLFKPVLFISDKEFQSLLERLAPVNAAAKTNQREPYINAMKALIRSLVPDITNEELDRQGIDQTMKLVAGLNEKSDALKDYTLLQISSRQAVPDDVYMSLVKGFSRKYSTLERIKKDQYKYTRNFNGITYYWIPIEQLP